MNDYSRQSALYSHYSDFRSAIVTIESRQDSRTPPAFRNAAENRRSLADEPAYQSVEWSRR